MLAWLQINWHARGKRKCRFYPIASFHASYVFRENVITTASTSEKLEWLLKIPNGPTHTVNYKTQDFAAEAKKITNGKGVNVIVDFPGLSHFVQNIDTLAVDGRMTMLALLSGWSYFVCHPPSA